MKSFVENPNLRAKLAKPARQMIVDRYEQQYVWREILNEYIGLLDCKGIKL